ncbi:NXPE family member 3-like [Branchiostoma floridae]|uniref:NXPE family member 3-like n=1 Tax=Branchiostoma floridae TaxID=7739 RepID=A0A9J7L643_BRAFL|nr:NXPE family member 3-like [Branchiostoma floridae]
MKPNATEERIRCFSSPYPRLPAQQQCDFSKPSVNGTWFCRKPKSLPCDSISKCVWLGEDSGLLDLVSQEEKKLFEKPYLEEELEANISVPIRVLPPDMRSFVDLPACPGKESASLAPGTQGHWSRGVWKSSICNVRVFETTDVQRCLANKTVYLYGDSTIRQWYEKLQTMLTLRNIKPNTPVLRSGHNTNWNVTVYWRFHHVPFRGRTWFNFSELSYAADQLDAIKGGPNTAVVLSLWSHFAGEPLDMIRSRLHAIRHAIHRLQRRDPGTHVFIRTGTTREHKFRMMLFYLTGSDWLAYQITEEIREMFGADPDVVVLDTWDMSVCQWGKDHVHPNQTVVDNQLNMLLSHVCPM